jgi:integrase
LDNYRLSLDQELIPRFGAFKLSAITADMIAAMIREMEQTKTRRGKPMSGSTIANHLKPLSGIFVFGMRHGYCGSNPVELLTPDERPSTETREMRILEPEEIRALLAASRRIAQKKTSHYDYTPILTLAINTGLRKGELLRLRWMDFDRKEGVLHVRHQITPRGELTPPKTAKSVRRIPIGREMTNLLRRLQEEALVKGQAKPDSFVFPSLTGKALSQRNVTSRGFEAAAREAKLNTPDKPTLTFHALRHCYASKMIAAGVNSTVLCKLMGHAHPGITEAIYIHLFDKQRTDALVAKAADKVAFL